MNTALTPAQKLAQYMVGRFGIEWVEHPDFLACFTSKRRRYYFVKNPGHAYVTELVSLSKLLDIEPAELVTQFGIGKNSISIDEMNQVLKEYGQEIQFTEHVA